MSHFRFTLFFHSPGISTWSICIGACHACTASQCDLRDPGWGDPGFRHCDFFALAPIGPSGVVFGFFCFQRMACSVLGTQVARSQHFSLLRSMMVLSTDSSLAFVCGFCVCLPFCFVLVFVWVFVVLLLFVFFVCFFLISVERHHTAWHYEHRKLTTVLASLAVISTASKHLHNDLAKAIEALEQKKATAVTSPATTPSSRWSAAH